MKRLSTTHQDVAAQRAEITFTLLHERVTSESHVIQMKPGVLTLLYQWHTCKLEYILSEMTNIMRDFKPCISHAEKTVKCRYFDP
jgi:hypothetical protein